MLPLLFFILKLAGYCLAAFAIYFVFEFYYKPLSIKKYFRKFSNIYVSEGHHVIFGDLKIYLDCSKQGRALYDHLKTNAKMYNQYDLMAVFMGKDLSIKMTSLEATQQLENLVPLKVDRASEDMSIGKMFGASFIEKRTTANSMKRRKAFMSALSLSSCSRYIPIMVQCTKEIIQNWKKGDTIDIIREMNRLTFNIFTISAFGQDMERRVKQETLDYETSAGIFEPMSLSEYFIQMGNDHVSFITNPMTLFLPFLNTYNLVNPFKRTKRNMDRFKARFMDLVNESKNDASILKQLLNGME